MSIKAEAQKINKKKVSPMLHLIALAKSNDQDIAYHYAPSLHQTAKGPLAWLQVNAIWSNSWTSLFAKVLL